MFFFFFPLLLLESSQFLIRDFEIFIGYGGLLNYEC